MLYHFRWLIVLVSLSIATLIVFADEYDPVSFGQAVVEINQQRLTVEYATTFEQRSRGLMFRKELCDSCGMLFKLEYPRFAGFWMRNTYVPLDIAYIDKQGVIADIKPMFPLNEEPVPSSRKVLYALEMNQGWFAKNNIEVGDKVTFVSQ